MSQTSAPRRFGGSCKRQSRYRRNSSPAFAHSRQKNALQYNSATPTRSDAPPEPGNVANSRPSNQFTLQFCMLVSPRLKEECFSPDHQIKRPETIRRVPTTARHTFTGRQPPPLFPEFPTRPLARNPLFL